VAEKVLKYCNDFLRADNLHKSIYYQVLLNNIRLIGAVGKRIKEELTHQSAQYLQVVKVRVHSQKNADNGQELTRASNQHDSPQLCCTWVTQRIKQ
jgi:hypothetical protein